MQPQCLCGEIPLSESVVPEPAVPEPVVPEPVEGSKGRRVEGPGSGPAETVQHSRNL